jgi:membrane protein required for colicin V production
MNLLDILMIVIVIYFVTMGFFRGLLRETASLIGAAGGGYLACMYYMKIAKYLSKWISDPSYLNIASFLIIFCTVFILVGILGIIIRYLLKIISFGWPDRVSGGIVAFVKGGLVVSILLMIFTAFLKDGSPIIRDSLFAPRVSVFSEELSQMTSKDMKDKFSSKIAHLRKTWKAKS